MTYKHLAKESEERKYKITGHIVFGKYWSFCVCVCVCVKIGIGARARMCIILLIFPNWDLHTESPLSSQRRLLTTNAFHFYYSHAFSSLPLYSFTLTHFKYEGYFSFEERTLEPQSCQPSIHPFCWHFQPCIVSDKFNGSPFSFFVNWITNLFYIVNFSSFYSHLKLLLSGKKLKETDENI